MSSDRWWSVVKAEDVKGAGMVQVPRNVWYVIALTEEISEHPLARTVCGEPIVCYRLPDGRAVALRDRCPHRRYPLSLGRLEGATLVCGYHGFRFDGDGRCVEVPGQSEIPPRCDVEALPLIEQGLWTWIFIGDEAPGRRLPQPTPWIAGDPGWTSVTAMASINCRFGLLVDNLLDLSHETYLHGANIGTPEVASTPVHTTIDRERNLVAVSRHMESVACPPFYERSTGLASPIDRWQDIEYFAPAYYQLHVRIAPARDGRADPRSDGEAFHLKILYGLTPSTDDTTYDFWAVCRDFALDDLDVTEYFDSMQRRIVIEDVDALNVLEQRIAVDPESFEAIAGIDRGALAARRMIAAMARTRDSTAELKDGDARELDMIANGPGGIDS